MRTAAAIAAGTTTAGAAGTATAVAAGTTSVAPDTTTAAAVTGSGTTRRRLERALRRAPIALRRSPIALRRASIALRRALIALPALEMLPARRALRALEASRACLRRAAPERTPGVTPTVRVQVSRPPGGHPRSLRSGAVPAVEPTVRIGYPHPMTRIVRPRRSPSESAAITVTAESIAIEKAGVDE